MFGNSDQSKSHWNYSHQNGGEQVVDAAGIAVLVTYFCHMYAHETAVWWQWYYGCLSGQELHLSSLLGFDPHCKNIKEKIKLLFL